MKKSVSAMEARRKFGEMLEGVFYHGDEVAIERNGKVMGVVISPSQYAIIEQNRDRLMAIFEESWRDGPQLPEDEAMDLALEAVRWARSRKKSKRKAS